MSIGIGIGIPFIRRRGGGPSNTPRTSEFLTATGITDATIINALNAMDTSLISAGLLPSGTGAGKIKALYPIVGGTASTHKFNFVNPLDTDAAFRLTFFGGWTHSANGALPNGSNAYANTFFNFNAETADYDHHVSNYSRTQNTGVNGVQIGVYDQSIGTEVNLFQYFAAVSKKGSSIYTYPSTAAFDATTNTQGLQIGVLSANNLRKMYFNGSLLNTGTNTESLNRPNGSIYLGASNWTISGASQYSPHEHAFDSLGTKLNDSEASNLWTLVQSFQTTLGRAV